MCINRSQRHCCLQGTLIFLLTICVIGFGAIIAIYLGVYYSTEQSIGLRQQRDLNGQNEKIQSLFQRLIQKRSNDGYMTTATTATTTSRSFEENLVHIFYKRDCPFNGWLVQSSILLDQCPYISQQMPLESLNNVQFNNCLRDSFWYLGMASIVPFLLTIITLIVACRLWLCPMITMAIVYLALALVLIIFTILYKSGSILTDGWPLFIGIIALVCLYALLSLLLITLFGLVTCERRRQQRPAKTNGTSDNDHMMKMCGGVGDDDDEIDDPNVPLYHHKNGVYSPQKHTDFDDKIKDFKYIDDDMSYVLRRG
ncbi:hypothetical protein DERF_012080 [Dermatophagoides farinae]|uniref:Uncharacterized protein n=1 Tax=Dermatophagoides farinae TaxID=6954 RepID=A0A922HP76_DERFA|nr:hypothetical protein DERF_012080 [Dermatophagoides farinae]